MLKKDWKKPELEGVSGPKSRVRETAVSEPEKLQGVYAAWFNF